MRFWRGPVLLPMGTVIAQVDSSVVILLVSDGIDRLLDLSPTAEVLQFWGCFARFGE